MVATREERRAMRYRRDRVPRPGIAAPSKRPVHVTPVNDWTVTTNASGKTLATIEGGSAVEFRGPYDLSLAQVHTYACRFLERRGPDYAPRTRLVITLDGRGRKRETVEG